MARFHVGVDVGRIQHVARVLDTTSGHVNRSFNIPVGQEGFDAFRRYLEGFSPNPFTHSLYIRGNSLVKIYSISGKFITEVKNHWSGRNLQGCNVPPGIYFLKSEGKYVGKVVKVR